MMTAFCPQMESDSKHTIEPHCLYSLNVHDHKYTLHTHAHAVTERHEIRNTEYQNELL